jgi:hypothetical protein
MNFFMLEIFPWSDSLLVDVGSSDGDALTSQLGGSEHRSSDELDGRGLGRGVKIIILFPAKESGNILSFGKVQK